MLFGKRKKEAGLGDLTELKEEIESGGINPEEEFAESPRKESRDTEIDELTHELEELGSEIKTEEKEEAAESSFPVFSEETIAEEPVLEKEMEATDVDKEVAPSAYPVFVKVGTYQKVKTDLKILHNDIFSMKQAIKEFLEAERKEKEKVGACWRELNESEKVIDEVTRLLGLLKEMSPTEPMPLFVKVDRYNTIVKKMEALETFLHDAQSTVSNYFEIEKEEQAKARRWEDLLRGMVKSVETVKTDFTKPEGKKEEKKTLSDVKEEMQKKAEERKTQKIKEAKKERVDEMMKKLDWELRQLYLQTQTMSALAKAKSSKALKDAELVFKKREAPEPVEAEPTGMIEEDMVVGVKRKPLEKAPIKKAEPKPVKETKKPSGTVSRTTGKKTVKKSEIDELLEEIK